MFKFSFILLALSCILPFALGDSDKTPEVEVVGNKFYFKNNGTQFLIRGVAYQENVEKEKETSFLDPLADSDKCKRDVKYLQELNTNVLRVYAVDPDEDHDECMEIFEDAGIYIIADLSQPNKSVLRNSPSWTVELYERYSSVVDMFANYSNVLGFFAGNEVTNNKSNTDASAFVKAAVRDTKAYISKKKYRSIPVGYSSNDDEDTRVAIADYFACGDDDEKADFFGINMYEWCGSLSFKSSGYEDRTNDFKNLSIPIFFSEYGCNEGGTRKFQEVGTIYGDKMTDVWSGGIVYMYFEEENEYGLVSVDGKSVSTMDDFKYLSSEINKISPSLAKSSSASKTSISCPATGSAWKASTKLPPTPDKEVCDCIADSMKCVVSDDVDEEDYGDLFGFICSKTGCSDITADGSKGKYGAVSYCDSKVQLSYMLNKYYESQDESSSACDFKGSASLKKGAKTNKSCSSKIASATKGSSSSSSSGSSSGSSGSASNSGSSSSSDSTSSSSSTNSASSLSYNVSKGEIIAIVSMVTGIIGGFSFILV